MVSQYEINIEQVNKDWTNIIECIIHYMVHKYPSIMWYIPECLNSLNIQAWQEIPMCMIFYNNHYDHVNTQCDKKCTINCKLDWKPSQRIMWIMTTYTYINDI